MSDKDLNYKNKYLKYKIKYLNLLNQNGGNEETNKILTFFNNWFNSIKEEEKDTYYKLIKDDFKSFNFSGSYISDKFIKNITKFLKIKESITTIKLSSKNPRINENRASKIAESIETNTVRTYY